MLLKVNLILGFLFCLLWVIPASCFIPAKIIDYILATLDRKTKLDFGEYSETIVHEEILRRGVIQSVVRFFYEQQNGSTKVNISKINNEYYDLSKLYYDYYGKWMCNLNIKDLISIELKPSVAIVDLDPRTKDLPSAHFDAEKFVESNQRVINFMNQIYSNISNKNYQNARILAGKILHTIQDFYSHSNWVEMGNSDRINKAIGTNDFLNFSVANTNDSITCINNCSYTETPCNILAKVVLQFIKYINITSAPFDCPLKFYKCSGNVYTLNKLISGYYTGQKLEDGSPVNPNSKSKCSHGGLMDTESFKLDTRGTGMNKDSGYFLFSPHADLHLIAANLAINHTEYFFNQIRAKIGDDEFSNFLQLRLNQSYLDTITITEPAICSSFKTKPVISILVFNILIIINFFSKI